MKCLFISHILCLLIVTCLLNNSLVHTHGFSKETLIQRCDGTWNTIISIGSNIAQGKNQCIASFDTRSSITRIHKKITHAGTCTLDACIRFSCDPTYTELSQDDIVCSPLQEFYCVATKTWTAAYALNVGDQLLSKNGPRKITYIEYVQKPLQMYALEVEGTHTLFVGHDSLLTHNMVLPVALSVGLGMSIGGGAVSGGSIGSFFGPITCAAGLAIGGMAGLIAKVIWSDTIPSYHAAITNTADLFNAHRTMRESKIASMKTTIIPTNTQSPVGCGGLVDEQHKKFCDQDTGYLDVLLVSNKPSGFPILSEKEKRELNNDCDGIPVQKLKKEDIVGCGMPSGNAFAEDFAYTLAKNNTENKSKPVEQPKERYNGPWYERTEDWVKHHPFAQQIKSALVRSDYTNQKKRAFEITKKLEGITGFSKGDFVVIDALHKDHLEVFNSKGKWKCVANFDGSKNEKKTERAKDEPRKPLQVS